MRYTAINSVVPLVAVVANLPLAFGQVALEDHFDNGTLDPAWNVSFVNASGWTFQESGTDLTVTDISPTVSDVWSEVVLEQPVSVAGDFHLDFDISWDSDGLNNAMMYLFIELLDSQSNTVVKAGYIDAWISFSGARKSSETYNGPYGQLPFAGSASIDIVRRGSCLRVLWDSVEDAGGWTTADIASLRIRYALFNSPPNSSFFGTEAVDLVRLEDLAPSTGCKPLLADPVGYIHGSNVGIPWRQTSGHLALGDVDNDGDLDMGAAFDGQNNDDRAILRLNNGDGTFGDPQVFSINQRGYGVAFADINSDGFADMVVSYREFGAAGLNTFINNGDGTMTPGGSYPGAARWDLSAGDLDNDGDVDFVAGNRGCVYRNNGDGTLTYIGDPANDGETYGSTLADWDGDGFLDLFYGARSWSGNDPVYIYKGLGDGTFGGILANFATFPITGGDVLTGDFNGDGILDLVISGGKYSSASGVHSRSVGVYVASATGTYQFNNYFLGGVPYDKSLGDVDGDGDIDIIVGMENEDMQLLRNNGDGTFAPWPINNTLFQDVILGDIDADGDLDLLATTDGPNSISGHVTVFTNSTVDAANPIPAASEWGLVAITLMLLTAGTIVLTKRRPYTAA